MSRSVRISAQSTRTLLILAVCSDGLLFGGGLPLVHGSFAATADPDSSIAFIAGLLAANLAMLIVACVAFSASSILLNRLVKMCQRKQAVVVRGEVNFQRPSGKASKRRASSDGHNRRPNWEEVSMSCDTSASGCAEYRTST